MSTSKRQLGPYLLAAAIAATAVAVACEKKNDTNTGTNRDNTTRPSTTPSTTPNTTTPTNPPATNPGTTGSRPVAPDNTARNAEDRKNGGLTPMDQSNADADVKISAAIRQKVVKSESLSTAAKNCKIITVAGEVTLRGVVESEMERRQIEALATETEGVKKVTNELEIKSAAS